MPLSVNVVQGDKGHDSNVGGRYPRESPETNAHRGLPGWPGGAAFPWPVCGLVVAGLKDLPLCRDGVASW